MRGRVLDYGCGPGFLIGDLLEMVPEATVYGLEHSQESLRLVNQGFGGHERFGGVSSATSIPTPFDDNYFDVVFFVETIEHIQASQRPKALRELRRLLRVGGMVVVTTPNEEDIEAHKAVCPDCGARFHVIQHLSSWSPASLQCAMEDAGFQTISSASTHLRAKASLLRAIRDRLVRKRYLPHLIYLGRAP
jgi:SAM-dependent methyltransferase